MEFGALWCMWKNSFLWIWHWLLSLYRFQFLVWMPLQKFDFYDFLFCCWAFITRWAIIQSTKLRPGCEVSEYREINFLFYFQLETAWLYKPTNWKKKMMINAWACFTHIFTYFLGPHINQIIVCLYSCFRCNRNSNHWNILDLFLSHIKTA